MSGPDDFERFLSECIGLWSERGEAALQEALAARPEHAARVRQRLQELERLGLLQREEPEPELIGEHRIIRRLGSGGMGTVYLAEEPLTGRRVALKLARLPVGAEGGDGAGGGGGNGAPDGRRTARARFAREVAAMAALSHPNLVAIRASGEHDGRPWFSMDHVPGATLSAVIARLRARGTPAEALTARDVRAAFEEQCEQDGAAAQPAEDSRWDSDHVTWCTRVALDVARALEHAHAHGVLHRDVKPSNILVRADGSARLFDFGLAQVDDQAALTRSGDIAGTPYALAPEQIDARCGAVDGRTDVWGLGVTLHEMLALRRPFDGAGPAALLRRILDEEPEPLALALQHVVATALEKPPRRRHADMTALREDLERFLARRGVRARGAGRVRRAQRFITRRPARAAALALAVLVVVAVPAGLLAANAAVREEARRAELAAQEARRQAAANAEVVGYLVNLFRPFEADDTELRAGTVAMLESRAQELELRFGSQPLVRAALLEATGAVYANLGQHARALPLYDRALAIRQTEQGESDPETVRLLQALARVHLEAGDASSARDLCRRVLAELGARDASAPRAGLATPEARAAAVARAGLAARAHTTLGRAEAQLDEPERAAAELATALDVLSTLDPHDDRASAEAHEAAADVAMRRGFPAQALAHGEQALSALLGEWFPDRRALVRAFEGLATWRTAAGDAAGAGAAASAAVTLRDAGRAELQATPVAPELRLATPWRARYEEAFQAGITALQARRLDDASREFSVCTELRPGSGLGFYNLACAHALAGRTAAALDWLERAAALGYGLGEGQDERMRADSDLASLRDEPRFDAVVASLREHGARWRAWCAEPGVHLPPARAGGGPLPLLVVLHADGSTRDAVLAGPWRQVADALGAALLAPSARVPLGMTPADGTAWFEDVERFARQPWGATDAALDELRAFFASHEVDRSRVLLAGEGSGALIALELALRAPGLVRGVLLVQGPALVESRQTRALTAAALGVRVAACIDPDAPLPWVGTETPGRAYAAALGAWLSATGLTGPGAFRTAPLPAAPAERAARLVEALAALER